MAHCDDRSGHIHREETGHTVFQRPSPTFVVSISSFPATRKVPDYFWPGMVMLETVIVSPFISPVSRTV